MVPLKMATQMASLREFPLAYLTLVLLLPCVNDFVLLQSRGGVEGLATLAVVVFLAFVPFEVHVVGAAGDEAAVTYFAVVSEKVR